MRRCAHCGRFVGRYVIVATDGRLACPACGPKVDGGQIQRDGNAVLRMAALGARRYLAGGAR